MVYNALAYVARKKTRTLIVLAILTLVLSCLFACIGILNSSKQVESSLYQSSNSSVRVKAKEEGGHFPSQAIPKLKEVQDVIYQYDGLARLTEGQVVEGSQQVTREDLGPELNNLVSVQATSHTDRDPLFNSGVFKLEEGRGIQAGDHSKALIHQDLAQANQLKLGDKLSLAMLGEKESASQEYEIVGIFSGKKQETYTGLSSDLSENMVFTDYQASQEGLGLDSDSQVATQVTLFSKDPDHLDQVFQALEDFGIDQPDYRVEKNTQAYEAAQSALAGIRQVIQLMTLAIMVAGASVLSLILILWIRDRVHEIGVLLAIGTSKLQVMGQFILELILISLPATILSIILGGALLNLVLSNLQTGQVIEMTGGLTLSLLALAQSYGALVAIIILSVLVASTLILVKHPKEILSQIS